MRTPPGSPCRLTSSEQESASASRIVRVVPWAREMSWASSARSRRAARRRSPAAPSARPRLEDRAAARLVLRPSSARPGRHVQVGRHQAGRPSPAPVSLTLRPRDIAHRGRPRRPGRVGRAQTSSDERAECRRTRLSPSGSRRRGRPAGPGLGARGAADRTTPAGRILGRARRPRSRPPRTGAARAGADHMARTLSRSDPPAEHHGQRRRMMRRRLQKIGPASRRGAARGLRRRSL